MTNLSLDQPLEAGVLTIVTLPYRRQGGEVTDEREHNYYGLGDFIHSLTHSLTHSMKKAISIGPIQIFHLRCCSAPQ
jgi:hypothetical protein